ncbi:hypothetical protein K1T71_000186 [Dendrolimus kikuchii]|uniref:Uncharacterized protein n=1 Tax=Dendrolimus kikuchii TaxID=765133 RepID=A0ACC1DJB5_9NEOP|nr:hypothetical protein K1T71_000186 [Dendrolimus kikuchii]
MGHMLRSDKMTFCDIYLQPEAAFEILSNFGEIGCVQFTDINENVQAFQRSYIQEVCRCAEMERQLYYLQSEMSKDNIYIPELTTEPKAMQPNEMTAMENMLEKWEDDVMEMSEYHTRLMKNFLELSEMYYVLNRIGPILGDAELRKESIFSNHSGGGGRLVVMTGVVRRTKCLYFELMLWRISRGNIYYRQAAEDAILEDPKTGQEIRKVAFLAICQGRQLSARMQKVFSGFQVNTYPCPRTLEERAEMMTKLDLRISDLQHVLRKTKFHRCKALRTVGRQWNTWIIQVRKAKAIYHTMNMFTLDITKKCLIGQCWVSDKDLKKVYHTLEYCSEELNTNVPSFMSKTTTTAVPPTYHRTNKFTRGFQALISAYGDSTYRELNPGLYTIITFPFLFAMMFGDLGHAIILVVFSTWMIVKEKVFSNQKSTNEIWNILFAGRYIILLLGLFSMYTGFIYNDIFGNTLLLKTPYWLNTFDRAQLAKTEFIEIDPYLETGTPYGFGIDPTWTVSTNKIMTENSYKMKLSIIVGIVHMIFGIVMSLFNYLYFKQYYLILLQFIPELLFMCCIFVWLVIMIYMKWFMYSAKIVGKRGSACAPQILILFIDMVLMKTTQPVNDGCDSYMFKGQKAFQTALLVIALLCIPVLLLGTPLYVNKYNKKMRNELMKKLTNFRRYQHRDSDKVKEELILAEMAPYMTTFSELLIHQGVHTIEYVLSTVSHTASYLRLWALSLAHSQLAEMLWEMIFSKLSLKDHTRVGCIKIFIIFAIWAFFTLSILVLMEGLSAFLHTLRLHWVEFMSKFYMGGGNLFRPFSFKRILATDEVKTEAGCKKKIKS